MKSLAEIHSQAGLLSPVPALPLHHVPCARREGLGLAEQYLPSQLQGLWLPYTRGTLRERAFQISPNGGGPVQAPADRMWLKEGARKGTSSGYPVPFLCLTVSCAGPPSWEVSRRKVKASLFLP